MRKDEEVKGGMVAAVSCQPLFQYSCHIAPMFPLLAIAAVTEVIFQGPIVVN